MSDSLGAYTRRRFLAAVLLTVTVVGSITILTTYLLPSPSNNATSTQVGSAFVAHLHNIESKNDSAVTREYADNATLNIAETTPDHITGTHGYSGIGNINMFWVRTYAVWSDFAPFTIGNASYTVKFSGRTALLNATFYLNEGPGCMFKSVVKATVSYVNSSGKWLISKEALDARDVNGNLCGGPQSNPT